MFEVKAQLKIRDGELDGFERQAAVVMSFARELDTKTLRYDWFISEDRTECEVREAYEDADALLSHQQAVAEAKMTLFREFVAGHTMTFYGDVSPALAGALKGMGTTFTAFSFMQGLDADIDVCAGALP